jgi:hypothetical protein
MIENGLGHCKVLLLKLQIGKDDDKKESKYQKNIYEVSI